MKPLSADDLYELMGRIPHKCMTSPSGMKVMHGKSNELSFTLIWAPEIEMIDKIIEDRPEFTNSPYLIFPTQTGGAAGFFEGASIGKNDLDAVAAAVAATLAKAFPEIDDLADIREHLQADAIHRYIERWKRRGLNPREGNA